MKAVLLVSHGSRSSRTREEVAAIVSFLSEKCPDCLIQLAFLEIEQPDIPSGIDLCVSKGAKEILVLLNFLNSGRHVDEDIPKLVEIARRTHPGVEILISSPVGQHVRIPELFLNMIRHMDEHHEKK